MNYIANSFFHFTPNIDNLINILQGDFYPRFCYENYNFLSHQYFKKGSDYNIAIPMVCFCDIPLTLIEEHSSFYGRFAIGMNHSWGERYLNPIFYLQAHSLPCKSLEILQKYLLLRNDKILAKDMFYSFQDFIAYIKPYKGKFHKDKAREKIFYREREWRWIPEIKDDAKDEGIILRILEKDKQNIASLNEEIREKYSLPYSIDDINYIVVDTNDSKKNIALEIEKIKSSKYERDQIYHLITKVISLQEINENF